MNAWEVMRLRKGDVFDPLVAALGAVRASVPVGAPAGLSLVVVPVVDLLRMHTYPLGKSGNIAVSGSGDGYKQADYPVDEQWEVDAFEAGPVPGGMGTWEMYAFGVGYGGGVDIKLLEFTASASRRVWQPTRPTVIEPGGGIGVWMVPGASPVAGNVPYKLYGRRLALTGIRRTIS